MRQIKLSLLAAITLLCIAASCDKTPNYVMGKLGLSTQIIEVPAEGGTFNIKLYCTNPWEGSITPGNESWVSITPMSGSGSADSVTLTIKVAKNEGEERSTIPVFTSAGVVTKAEGVPMERASFAIQQAEASKVQYTSIKDLRAMFKGSEFTITEDLYIKGTVISNFRKADAGGLNNATSAKSVVVSDGVAGISLRLVEDNATLAKDDEVSISLKGAKMQLYQELLQINELPNAQIEKIGTKPLTAVPITAAQLLSGDYESMYVAVKNVQVAKADIGKKLGNKNSHTSINFVSKEGDEFVLFSSKYSTFMDDVVPSGSGFLKGVAMVFGNTYQVAITAKSDLEGLNEERFGQDGPGTGPVTELKSDPVRSWMELPKVEAKEGQAYISHNTTINGKEVRNYSMLYDSNNKLSLWVAYPLCGDYLGGTGRSDKWEYDPKVPQNMQPVLYKSYSNSNTHGRGHQLPSADRTVSYSTNAQTFYFTNMTSQNHDMNGGVWAKLESLVRNAAKTCDTLYVVTGPIIKTDAEPNIEYTTDNNGAKVAVPKGYFKVLLKYKKSDSSYSAVGFWYDNKSYASSREPMSADAYSLEDIEKKTGHTFFNNLPAEVKKSVTTSYKASEWGL